MLVRSMFEPAVTVWLTFEDGDTRLKHATVEFTFVPPEGKHRDCATQTGDDGRCRVVTPPMSMLKHMRATATQTAVDGSRSDNEVRKRGDIAVPKPLLDVDGHKPTIRVNVSKNQTHFASKVLHQGLVGADKCLLVDISGSMYSGSRMDVLRDSCVKLLENLMRENGASTATTANAGDRNANSNATSPPRQRIMLGAWDSHVEWCNGGSWIEEPSEANFEWCRARRPRGGNNMRYAIEETMRQCPGVREVFVMCDGDLSPFALIDKEVVDDGIDVPKPASYGHESSSERYSGCSWQRFRNRWPNSSFHFIALSRSADEHMQSMAIIGHGTYSEVDAK